MSRGTLWNGRTRYTVVTDSGFGAESYDLAPVQRAADRSRSAGWNTIVVQARTKAERDRKAEAHWDACRRQRTIPATTVRYDQAARTHHASCECGWQGTETSRAAHREADHHHRTHERETVR